MGRERTRIFDRRQNALKFIDKLELGGVGASLYAVKMERREVGSWKGCPREDYNR